MEFQSEIDFDFYNNISEPIIVINIENEIIYCNESVLDFLGIHDFTNIYNTNINNAIKFITPNYDELDLWSVINEKKFAKINIQAEINQYKNMKMDLVAKHIIDYKEKYLLLLFNNIKTIKESFRSDSSEEKKIYSDESESFKYIMMNEQSKEKNKLNLNIELCKIIFSASPTGIIVEKENKISYFNKAANDIIGDYSNDMILDKKLFELVTVEELEYNDIFLKKQHLKYNSDLNVIERKLTRKDGSVVFCEITPMCFLENTKICSIFLIRDISKRIKVEEAVAKNRDNYVRLLKFLPFGVTIYSNNEFDIANEAQARILGFDSTDELERLTIEDIIHEDYHYIVNKMYNDAYLGKEDAQFKEIQIKKKDRGWIDVEVGVTGIEFEYGRSVVFIIRELTESKKAELNKIHLEQAIKYDRLKTEFISNMSHELKTPLNIILSTVQLLQHTYKENEDCQLKNYLELMKSNSYRLLRLINNLLDVTRIDVGNLKMNFGNYDIVAIVENMTMDAVEYVKSKGMSLTFDTNVEEKIIGIDKENIERVILNLLSNAVKFSKEKGVILVEVCDLGDKVQIAVKDNGIGIAEDMQDKIFDRFVQSESLFTRSHEGSGIGLSLVKSIVENHGGEIYVNSIIDVGSEFIFELPNVRSKNEFTSSKIYNVTKDNIERIKIEFADIYK
ncbi:MAG: PAS domain-containing sensor histidine kinase [Clostridium sp.]